MTDLIERTSAPSIDDISPDRREGAPDVRVGVPVHLAPGPVLVAVVLGCSAILLFLTATPRFASWRAGAIALVFAAWLQIALGVGGLVRPSRALFAWMAGANVAIAGLWVAVQVGHHDSSALATGVGIALSGVAVVVAVALALRPSIGVTWTSSTLVQCSVIPVALVVLTTTALSMSAPASSGAGSSGAGSAGSGTATPSASSSSVAVPGQSSARFLQIASGNDTEKSELKPYAPLDPATQALLSRQLEVAELAALRFPTVADAKRAGMILAGGMAPGVGAHYQALSASSLKGVNPDGSVNPAYPASWIYASTADNAPVVGIMYESLSDNAPSGFAGPNDHWHQHTNLCIGFKNGMITVPFAPDTSVTPQECADVHGSFIKKSVWMVHAWVVPGWESPQGVFSHANLHVYCPGNTDLTDAIGFCIRQQ
jgi:hypothetical protein